MSLLDVREEINAIIHRHGVLLLRPHPIEGLEPAVSRALASTPGVFVTDRHAYDLLTAPDIAAVYSLSSSVLSEARLFGKPSFALAPEVHGHAVTVTLEGFARSLAKVLGVAEPKTTCGQGALRRIVGMDWNATADPLAQLGRKPPELTEGRHSFGSGEALAPTCFAYGWAPAEEWGTWSTGSLGVLEWRWPEGERRRAKVTVHGYVGPSDGRGEWAVIAHGAMPATIAPRVDGGFTAVLTLDPPPRGEHVQVGLWSSRPMSAHRLGEGEDHRYLGASVTFAHVKWLD